MTTISPQQTQTNPITTTPAPKSTAPKDNLPPVLTSSLKVSVLGNVDSGKSTLVGCVCTGQRDSGRGSLRALVASHPHEAATGRTTNAAHHLFGYDATGKHVFYNPLAKQQNDNSIKVVSAEETHNIKINKAKAWHHIVSNSARVVTLLDLAGHQKYLRTSISHLVSNMADVALILVSPNTGLSKMTIEHFSLCVALRIRICVLVTKIDKAPLDVLKTLRVDLNNFITYQTQRTPITIKGYSEIQQVLGGGEGSLVPPESYVPIFYISSTTLQHFDLLHAYLARVQPLTWLNGGAGGTQNQVVNTDSAQDVDVAKRNKIGGGGDGQNNIDAENHNNTNHHVTTQSQHQQHGSHKNHYHHNDLLAMSVQSKSSLGENDETTTISPSIQPTMASALLPTTNTLTTTCSGTTSVGGAFSMNGDGNNNNNNTPETTGQHADSVVGGAAASSSASTTANNTTTATPSALCPLHRDVGIPSYLQPLVSGELRVEDRFYKANTGLILSGTVTFGAFDVTKTEQLVLLGPFCSKSDPKSAHHIAPQTAEAIHHATKKNAKHAAMSATGLAGSSNDNNHKGKNNNNKNNSSINAADAKDQILEVEFLPVIVKSIQQYRTTIPKAGIGEGVGICIKYDEKTHKLMQKGGKYRSKYNHLTAFGRDDILKGMCLIGLATPQTMQTASFPVNKLNSAHDLIVPATKQKTTTVTTPKIPTQFTLSKYQFPYQLFLSSSIDIDIEVLNPASCFRQGYQIVMHCSALVLPIIIESVLCVMDKPKTAFFHNKATNNIIEMSAAGGIVDGNGNGDDNRRNPSLTEAIEQAHQQQPNYQIPINNDILLRYGQRGILRCRFLHQPFVYIHEGEQVLLRDGSTRAIGTVSATFY